ncbi:flagellar hook-basal body protein [Sphingomonas sp.]|uniref:flagellar hook-basal body protein n=1 Tax=Sphingomonas sp. TaxID=28214 RepID=UPI001B011E27|nr:flagellar hook-basal body protein [Sphingomonas sp.]MBO9714790.1 flagellar hook-basal body protein [Sphingomonas sp.]
MSDAFSIGAVGLGTQQRALDGIAANITNVNTPAFKRSQIRFADVVASRVDPDAPVTASSETAAMAGVRLDSEFMLNQAGEIDRTGNAMDLAIEGNGFIELMGPGGQTLLWRGGALKLDEDGMLAASASGLALRASVTVPADASKLEIAADGTVRATMPDQAEPVELGQLQLVQLDDPAQIERLDGGLYRVLDGSPVRETTAGEDGAGQFVQGGIERSNVALTDEMVQLMLVQRAYAANAQIVQAADQMMAIANGLRR